LFNEYQEFKGLAGFNVPNSAKQLYRIRRGKMQPWPLKHTEFNEIMLKSFDLLESIAETCFKTLVSCVGIDYKQLMKIAGEPETIPDNRNLELTVKIYCKGLSASPFDLFYYHNQPSGEDTANCNEHVDPGFVTVVPCAEVPGLGWISLGKGVDRSLGVFDLSLEDWICVEEYLRPFTEVTVICDQVLAEISGVLPAAVHRVTKNKLSRLSLVYEIRPTPGVTKEMYSKINKL
jgi:hypothetical protein